MSSLFGDASNCVHEREVELCDARLTKHKIEFTSAFVNAVHNERLSDKVIVAGGFAVQTLNNKVMEKILHGGNGLSNHDNVDIDLFIDRRTTKEDFSKITHLIKKFVNVIEVKYLYPLDYKEQHIVSKDKESMFRLTNYCKVLNFKCAVKRPLSTSSKHTATFEVQMILFKEFDNYKELLDSFDLQVSKHAILHTSNTDLTILGSGVKSKGTECWLPDSVFNKSNGVSIDCYTYIKSSRTKALPISNLQSLSRYKKYIQRYRIMKYFKQKIDSEAIKNTVKVSLKDCSDALISYQESMPFHINNQGLASPVKSIICTLFNNAVNTYTE